MHHPPPLSCGWSTLDFEHESALKVSTLAKAQIVMDLKQLRYFVSVVTNRSITKASEKLYIAQPALSRQIQLLEEEFGVQLLIRGPRGVELTQSGRRFKEKADVILSLAADMKSSLTMDSVEVSGHIVVGIPPSLVTLLAARMMEEGARRFPRLKIRIVEALSVVLAEWLEQGQLDVALMSDFASARGQERTTLVEEELVLVGAPSLLKEPGDSAPLTNVERYPMIATHAFRAMMMPWFIAQQIEPAYEMELDSISTVKELLFTARYCSILPYSLVHREVERSELRALRFAGSPVRRGIVLATMANRQPTPAVRAVGDLIKELLVDVQFQLHDGLTMTA